MEIRIAKEQDAEAILSIYGIYIKETAITFEYEIPTIEEFQGRIRNVLEKYPYLVAEEEGEVIGYAYATPFHTRPACDWAVEVSIYVKKYHKRGGIGSKLYQVLEEILKNQGVLNVNVSIAYPDEEDEYLTKDSFDFHKKMGYQLVGTFHKCGYKFGRWYHLLWMEKMLGEHLEDQERVKKWSETTWMKAII